jgi:GNAT superfamily N-acetyltransferase
MEANAQEAALLWGRVLHAQFYTERDITLFVSSLPFHMCNGIIRTQLTGKDIDAKISEVAKLPGIHHVPMVLLVGPSTLPSDIEKRLGAYGWFLDDEAPGMAIDLLATNSFPSIPSKLSVKEVTNGEMLQQWIRTMTTGSNIPDSICDLLLDLYNQHGFTAHPSVRYYLGLLDGKPVATSLLFLGGGVAGIYNVATLPEARKRGFGTALTVVPLLEARSLGYRFGILQSTAMGLNIYRRIGFQEYCTFRFYFSPT